MIDEVNERFKHVNWYIPQHEAVSCEPMTAPRLLEFEGKKAAPLRKTHPEYMEDHFYENSLRDYGERKMIHTQ